MMSYLILAVVLLVVLLSMVALFDEAREMIQSGKRRANKAEKAELIQRALIMKGQLHKIDAVSFEKLVAHIYEELGYRTKNIRVGNENVILLEQKGVYTLVGYKNHGWPISRETLETLYHHKKRMTLDAMIVISTGGFNLSAWEWARENEGVKLLNAENIIDLCNEISAPPASLPSTVS
jgi:hypothetical protein